MSSPQPFVRVAAQHSPPWTIYKYNEQNVLGIGGVMGSILEVLAETIEFDYEIVPPPDNVIGSQLTNGSWTGMIGLIERGEADFALYPFTITPTRKSVAAFTIPFYRSNIAILTPRPKIEYDMQGVLKPFSMEVWLCTLFSLVAITIGMIITEKVESMLYNYEISDLTAKSLMWSTKALTQEGSDWLPSANGGRLIVTTWLLASLIFMSCFSGILIAMLTVPKVTIPVDSVEDLVAQSKIPWKMLPGAFELDFLRESESIFHQKAYAHMAGTIPSLWEAKEQMTRGDYAVIDDDVTFRVLMNWDYSTNGHCNLYLARENVFSNFLVGIAFRTHSVYLERTNNILAILMESGILDHWVNQLLVNASYCLKSPSNDRAAGSILALNLEAFWGSYILLFIGFFIATAAFFLEILL